VKQPTIKVPSDIIKAQQKVADDYQSVRQNLIKSFPNIYDLELTIAAQKFFTKLDLKTAPVVLIPYTQAAYNKALNIVKSSRYPLPFLVNKLDIKINNLPPSHDIPDCYLGNYNVCIITDQQKILDEKFSHRNQELTDVYVHEQAHSVFQNTERWRVKLDKSGAVNKILGWGGLRIGTEVIYQKNKTESDYVATWIDEAVACYLAGQYRKQLGASDKSYDFDMSYAYGKGNASVKEHYVFCVKKGNQLYLTHARGAVAGQALEMLDEKFPVTIDQILEVARGNLSPAKFRRSMRQILPKELYQKMFTRQPYNTWLGIYRAIKSL
jgi:hypothetical protein